MQDVRCLGRATDFTLLYLITIAILSSERGADALYCFMRILYGRATQPAHAS